MLYDVGQIWRWREMAKVIDTAIGGGLSNFIPIADLGQFSAPRPGHFRFLAIMPKYSNDRQKNTCDGVVDEHCRIESVSLIPL